MSQDDSSRPVTSNPLPVELALQVDLLCEEYKRLRPSGRLDLQTYLVRVPIEGQDALRAGLAAVEAEYLRSNGSDVPPDVLAQMFGTSVRSLENFQQTRLSGARPAAGPLGLPLSSERPWPEPAGSIDQPAAAGAAAGLQLPPTQRASLPRLFGDYELLEVLGQGGMGTVYRARHPRLGRDVAIKVIRAESSPEPKALARFEREVHLLGGLDHPHIVEALHAGEQDGQPFLVMRLLDGCDLAHAVERHGPLHPANAAEAARQAAAGLQAIHQQGLIHRDIKPSNLMLTRKGVVQILDLGLARLTGCPSDRDKLTGTSQGPGTVDYMAPEQQSEPDRLTIAGDLYALGCVLFHLLAGQPPFAHRSTLLAKLLAHQQEPPPDLHTLRPGLPEELVRLIGRLLAKAPAERPRTPDEVVEALAPLAVGADLPGLAASVMDEGASAKEGETKPKVLADVKTWLAPTPRLRWVRPKAMVMASAIVLLLVFGFFLLSHLGRRPDSSETGRKTIQTQPTVLEPVRVQTLNVLHFGTIDAKRTQPRGVLGKESFVVALDDDIKVTAKLSRPAFSYLIVFRPDGKDEVLYPQGPQFVPERTAEPRYPSRDRDKVYGLSDGAGLWLVVLVASVDPLPSYSAWREQHPDCPWRQTAGESGVVWFDDGQWLEAMTPQGLRTRSARGEKKAVGLGSLVQVVDWLKAKTGGTVSAVGFTVEGR